MCIIDGMEFDLDRLLMYLHILELLMKLLDWSLAELIFAWRRFVLYLVVCLLSLCLSCECSSFSMDGYLWMRWVPHFLHKVCVQVRKMLHLSSTIHCVAIKDRGMLLSLQLFDQESLTLHIFSVLFPLYLSACLVQVHVLLPPKSKTFLCTHSIQERQLHMVKHQLFFHYAYQI